MTIPEYIKARKKKQCTYHQLKRDAHYHQELGKILEEPDEKAKMETGKGDLVTPPAQELDFIY